MKLPQLSLPWAIVAAAVIAGLVVLLVFHVVTWPVLAAFLGGVVIPALKSSEDKSPPAVPPLPMLFFVVCFVPVFGLLALACTAREVAKDEYTEQKKACVNVSVSREELFDCWAGVDKKWNEAGAPPAAILDGGAQ